MTNPYESINQTHSECICDGKSFMAGVYANGKIEIAAYTEEVQGIDIKVGSSVTIGGFTFKVKKMERSRLIKTMQLITLTE